MTILIIISEVLSILFNPLYGGIGKAITEVISYIIEPDGAWIPFILAIITALTDGILIGLLWRVVKKVNKLLFIIIAGLSAVLFIFLSIEYAIYSIALIIIFIVSDIIINKNGSFTKIYICITLTGFISALINGTPLNDVIFICCIKTYMVVFIINIYNKIAKKS